MNYLNLTLTISNFDASSAIKASSDANSYGTTMIFGIGLNTWDLSGGDYIICNSNYHNDTLTFDNIDCGEM